LKREISLITTDPPPGVCCYVPGDQSNIANLRAQITGPEGSPFADAVFLLTVHIPPRYPFEPPKCRFVTNASSVSECDGIYHPNIDTAGRICLDTLKSPPAGSWSPAVSLASLLLGIRTLLGQPNPDDGLMPDISNLYKTNMYKWENEAKKRCSTFGSAEGVARLERMLDGIPDNFEEKDIVKNTTEDYNRKRYHDSSGNSENTKGDVVIICNDSNKKDNFESVGICSKKSKIG